MKKHLFAALLSLGTLTASLSADAQVPTTKERPTKSCPEAVIVTAIDYALTNLPPGCNGEGITQTVFTKGMWEVTYTYFYYEPSDEFGESIYTIIATDLMYIKKTGALVSVTRQ